MTPPTEAPAVEMRGITKRFGTLVADDQVDLVAPKGTIHALVGENGAGKSTLMNMLYGLYIPDSGEILVHGKPVVLHGPGDAIKQGIGMVHQHFMLVPPLTVAENIVLGAEPPSLARFPRQEAIRRVTELAARYGLRVDPTARVGELPVGLQQRVEILKTLYRGAEILILDEPTAVLTPQETDELFVVLRDLVNKGKTILFISHKLREVMSVADQISVLRRGKKVATLEKANTSREEIARLMVGREILPQVERGISHPGEPILEVRDLRCDSDRGLSALKGLSFTVRAGEVLGIAGVEGNGQSELVDVLTGLRHATGGTVTLHGQAVTNATPRRLRDLGLAAIPEDRHARGLILDYSVANNLVLGSQDSPAVTGGWLLNPWRILDRARRLIGQFDIRGAVPATRARSLSGGNQQKVVLAREIDCRPRFLIAAQPTRGLDIGAIQFVHQQLLAERDKGVGILLVSAELDEILALSDRIAVLYEGHIPGTFTAEEATEERLGILMTGGSLAPEPVGG
ncbi:MAG TPA: ABC transporter ATP-binding protein [Chloroflexota bacterium]|jgi:simple sugar transport system ATP-binding protein